MQAKQDDGEVVFILADHKEIRVSRQELSSSCDFFSSLLNSDMKENREGIVRLENITEACIRNVLEFMRCGSVEITPENAEDMIKTADFFLFPRLKNFSANFLGRTLTPLNCLSVYYFAKKYRCEDLMIKCKICILSNFAAVMNTRDFLNLDIQEVEELICSDDITVSPEDVIFKAIIKWIEHKEKERKGMFEQLFRYLRLDFVSHGFLRSKVMTNDLVSRNSNCSRLVKEALEGKCHSQSLSNWTVCREETHLVVFTGKTTLSYEPDKNMWSRLPDTNFSYSWPYRMCSVQGKFLCVLPNCPSDIYRLNWKGETAGEWFIPSSRAHWLMWYQNNPSANQYRDLKELLTIRRLAVAVVKGQLLAMDLFFDPSDDTYWISKHYFNTWEIFPCNGIKEINASSACIVTNDKHLYILGGRDTDRGRPTSSAGRVHIRKRTWERIADMKMPRYGACGIATLGQIFIAGGHGSEASDSPHLDTCEVYDVETDEWQFIASLNSPRFCGSMVYFQGMLYVVGGDPGPQNELVITVESYDFEDKRWKQKAKILGCGDYSERVQCEVSTLDLTPEGSLTKPVRDSTGLLASVKRLFLGR